MDTMPIEHLNKATPVDASRSVGQVAARISRLEGRQGHARTGDARLHEYYRDEKFELGPLGGRPR